MLVAPQVEDVGKDDGGDAAAAVHVQRDGGRRRVARKPGAGVAQAPLEDEEVARSQLHRLVALNAEVAVSDGDEHGVRVLLVGIAMIALRGGARQGDQDCRLVELELDLRRK